MPATIRSFQQHKLKHKLPLLPLSLHTTRPTEYGMQNKSTKSYMSIYYDITRDVVCPSKVTRHCMAEKSIEDKGRPV